MTVEVSILALLGVLIIGGYYVGQAVRPLRVPSLIGYMLLGIVLGPSLLGWFDRETLDGLSFITEIILGFVAFSIGAELSIASLKQQGWGIISIILTESLLAFGLVTLAVYLVTGDLPMSLFFGAMAPASAPAGTVAVIHETKAKGPLTRALYAVVGFDDGLAIVIFGIAAAAARYLLVSADGGEVNGVWGELWRPIRELLFSAGIGCGVGFVFCLLMRRVKSASASLIHIFGALFAAIGLSQMAHASLILTNMFVGFVLVNFYRERDVQQVTRELYTLMPLMFILFFGLAGAHLRLGLLPQLGLTGAVYMLARSLGLVGGARIGAFLGGVRGVVQKYVGMGILSQAGVAIGLAMIVKQELASVGGDHAERIGAMVLTTVTATSVIFEIIGPMLARHALEKAGETRG
ncbi:cation:proton antiporter [Kiritimatiella glycovorans]|uniref:Transporter, monovalent cation:proton antiporter-2 (CPA2) family n=1 Tax=Kiritimatiella glycovorans TaxID=1307763 RepID=A0A0G3EFF2_9BACT|nr:cation:proton antiporter [Kiritimatiella glycovorans]AKJ63515.1 transporter, monovalent cation:proton antiporter-2 (CPA2) family [Kiritimatiella glycovorans]